MNKLLLDNFDKITEKYPIKQLFRSITRADRVAYYATQTSERALNAC